MKTLTLALLLFSPMLVAETRLEIGPTYLSDERSSGYMFIVSERVGKFDFGIGYVSEQDVLPGWENRHGYGPVHLSRNAFFYVQRFWTKGQFELGAGLAHFNNENRALGAKITYPVSIGWNWNENLSIRLRHFSNAGAATPNLGQDSLTIGWTF